MPTRRTFLLHALGATALVTVGAAACGSGDDGARPKSVTAVTKVYGDGLKLAAVAVEYDTAVAASKLSKSDFSVADRTVTKVYAHTSAALADQGTDGRYVIVELSPDDAAAALWPSQLTSDDSGPGGDASGGARPSGQPTDMPSGSAMPSGGPGGDGGGSPVTSIKDAKATVTQKKDLATTDGATLAGGASTATDAVVNLIVDDFKKFSFKDSDTGETLKYNLYIPDGYDSAQSYPLVLFMPDATATSTVTRTTLVQGLGAVCWASPEDQAKRKAFVLAPQYSSPTVDDSFQASDMLDTTVNLLTHLTGTYSIDTDRLYATGQSGGGMMALAMNIKHPDLFAASLIVAAQWDPDQVDVLADSKLWIVVSKGDEKAYPYENKITKILEGKGAEVSRATWDGTWSADRLASAADTMAAKGASVNYSMFVKGTVVPDDAEDNATNEHLCTWRVAYTIAPIRDWIFEQSK